MCFNCLNTTSRKCASHNFVLIKEECVLRVGEVVLNRFLAFGVGVCVDPSVLVELLQDVVELRALLLLKSVLHEDLVVVEHFLLSSIHIQVFSGGREFPWLLPPVVVFVDWAGSSLLIFVQFLQVPPLEAVLVVDKLGLRLIHLAWLCHDLGSLLFQNGRECQLLELSVRVKRLMVMLSL